MSDVSEATDPRFHLAQANVAYARYPMDDPRMSEFVARLDELNRLADTSPGFVWRFLTDSRDPAQREFDDPRVLFNLSVWTSVEALHRYTYRTAHAEVYAARKRWFEDQKGVIGGTAVALFWVPIGQRPSVGEAKERLLHLEAHGPSERAFTFKRRYPPPGL